MKVGLCADLIIDVIRDRSRDSDIAWVAELSKRFKKNNFAFVSQNDSLKRLGSAFSPYR